jgi:hypothetical protein
MPTLLRFERREAFLLGCESGAEGTISDFPHFMDGFFLFSDQPHAIAETSGSSVFRSYPSGPPPAPCDRTARMPVIWD